MLYWDIDRMILDRRQRAGWGTKIIDLLSVDLVRNFPEMRALSPRNLRYMRAFAAAWPERSLVQDALAQLPWYQDWALRRLLLSATAGARAW